ncbi:MAG: phage tail assembly protein [Elusimicrobiota bacterium]|jgi:hypothetical protein|nr:phage tail assembly protein [Elusimicrobiota bacterium]
MVKIEKDAAEKILQDIFEKFEITSAIEKSVEKEKILDMIMYGILEFENKKIFLNLSKSIKNEAGIDISKISLVALTGQSLVDAEKNNKNGFEVVISYISSSSGLPFGCVLNMDIKDIKRCQEVMTLFL